MQSNLIGLLRRMDVVLARVREKKIFMLREKNERRWGRKNLEGGG